MRHKRVRHIAVTELGKRVDWRFQFVEWPPRWLVTVEFSIGNVRKLVRGHDVNEAREGGLLAFVEELGVHRTESRA